MSELRKNEEGGKKYYSDGALGYEGYFKNGKKDGEGKEYDRDGKLIYEGHFKDGKWDGKGKEYDKDGHLIYEGYFKDGDRDEKQVSSIILDEEKETENKMERLEELTNLFLKKNDEFLIACDEVEEKGLWDKEEYGEMDVFFQNEVQSVIIHLIALDGVIHEGEVDYLNKNFRIDYTKEELQGVYDNCSTEIDHFYDDNFKSGLSILRDIDKDLAALYIDLFCTICDIIVESDAQISEAELEELKRLKMLK